MTYDLIRELKPFSTGIHVFTGLPGSELYDQMIESGGYVYKDHLGLLYSHDYNRLAVHINSYLLENKFCPVQSIQFRIYKVIRKKLLQFARKHSRTFKRFAYHSLLIRFDEAQVKFLALMERLLKKKMF